MGSDSPRLRVASALDRTLGRVEQGAMAVEMRERLGVLWCGVRSSGQRVTATSQLRRTRGNIVLKILKCNILIINYKT